MGLIEVKIEKPISDLSSISSLRYLSDIGTNADSDGDNKYNNYSY